MARMGPNKLFYDRMCATAPARCSQDHGWNNPHRPAYVRFLDTLVKSGLQLPDTWAEEREGTERVGEA